MTRIEIGELAITACQSLSAKNYSLAIETSSRVVAELNKLELAEAALPEDAQRAIRQCESILSDCEELPERADEFKDGVTETVESIQSWIEENRHVTDKQLAALDNMQEKVGNWLHR
jgi:translation elongation factor EF-4